MTIKRRLTSASLALFMFGTAIVIPADMSPAASVSAAQLDAPEGISYTSGKDSITLTWDEVDGAEAYRVYKYNASKKKYEKYKTVASESCTVDGLKSGSTYHFRVASLDKKDSSYTEGGHNDIKAKVSSNTKAKSKTKTSNATTSKKYNKKAIPMIPDILSKYGWSSSTGNSNTITTYKYTNNIKEYIRNYDDVDIIEDWIDKVENARDGFFSRLKQAGYSLELSKDDSYDYADLNFKYDLTYKVYYNGEHVANLKYVFLCESMDRKNTYTHYEYSTSETMIEVKNRVEFKFSYNNTKYEMK